MTFANATEEAEDERFAREQGDDEEDDHEWERYVRVDGEWV
jgi:hypothetical protein